MTAETMTVEDVRRKYGASMIAGTPETYRCVTVLLADIDRLTTIKDNLYAALERKEDRIKRIEHEHIKELREVQGGGISWKEATS